MPTLGSEKLSAYINDRFINDDEKLISDIFRDCKFASNRRTFNDNRHKKAFDCVNQFFLISVIKQCRFEDDYIKWIKALLKNQESCVFNGGKNNFTLIKINNNIEVLNIFNHNFLYTVYADDATFFIKKYKFCNINHQDILFFLALKSIKQNAKSLRLVCRKK